VASANPTMPAESGEHLRCRKTISHPDSTKSMCKHMMALPGDQQIIHLATSVCLNLNGRVTGNKAARQGNKSIDPAPCLAVSSRQFHNLRCLNFMLPTSNPARNMMAIVGSGEGIGTGSPLGARELHGEGGVSSTAVAFPYVGGTRA